MDPTYPSPHQPDLFSRTEEIEPSALDLTDIKEVSELALPLLRRMLAQHEAARARRLQGSLPKTYHLRNKGWIRSKRAPKARKPAPQKKGRAA